MPSMPKKIHRGIAFKVAPKPKKKTWLKDERDVSFYNSATWRKLSIAYKQRNPVCEVSNCTQPSYFTDHIVPISEGGDKLNTKNLQALCKRCNASKTAKQRSK